MRGLLFLPCLLLITACAVPAPPTSQPTVAFRTMDHPMPEALRSQLVDGFPEGTRAYVQVRGSINLHFMLLAGGHYLLQTYGCQGRYAVVVGTWTLSNSRVLLTPLEERGDLADPPLRVLHVRQLANVAIAPVLIPEADLSTVESQGATAATCFHDPRFAPWSR